MRWGACPERFEGSISHAPRTWDFFEQPVNRVFQHSARPRACRFATLNHLEQAELRNPRPAKMLGGQFRPPFSNPGFLAGQLEQLRHLLRENTLTPHPALEVWIIELAAPNGADAIEHFFFSLG